MKVLKVCVNKKKAGKEYLQNKIYLEMKRKDLNDRWKIEKLKFLKKNKRSSKIMVKK